MLSSLPECQATSPEALSTISYVIAAMTAGGGIMGYAKTRSVPSIVAGCTVGFLCKATMVIPLSVEAPLT
jgi:uncharacterized membrane protein (UPF0136 family)